MLCVVVCQCPGEGQGWVIYIVMSFCVYYKYYFLKYFLIFSQGDLTFTVLQDLIWTHALKWENKDLEKLLDLFMVFCIVLRFPHSPNTATDFFFGNNHLPLAYIAFLNCSLCISNNNYCQFQSYQNVINSNPYELLVSLGATQLT